MKIFGKTYDNKALVVGGILTAILCGLPYIGEAVCSIFAKIQEFVLGLFPNKKKS